MYLRSTIWATRTIMHSATIAAIASFHINFSDREIPFRKHQTTPPLQLSITTIFKTKNVLFIFWFFFLVRESKGSTSDIFHSSSFILCTYMIPEFLLYLLHSLIALAFQGWFGGVFALNSTSGDGDVESQESSSLLSSTYRSARTTLGLDPSEPPPPSWMPQLSRTERLKGFVICMIVSLIFFALAFLIGLPMVVLAPTKFAISFTLGSISFMLSFAILEGPWEHFKRVFSSERLPFTVSYVFTIIGTLYCSLSWRNYLATVLFSCLQITALLWYVVSWCWMLHDIERIVILKHEQPTTGTLQHTYQVVRRVWNFSVD